MSRKIEPKASVTMTEEEMLLQKTDVGKLIFTSYQERRCALLIRNNRLIEASFFPKEPGKIGAIYIAKVKNVVKNINACFVEIAKGELCFLSLEDAKSAYLLNRGFDGRILEGDELLVQVVRDAQKSKRASVTAQISLANDYFAMALGSEKIGYSSKLSKEKKEAIKRQFTEMALQRNGCLMQGCEALLSIAEYDKLKSEGMVLENFEIPPISLVVRTKAGEVESKERLEHFFELSTQLVRLLYIAKYRSCFSCLKEAEAGYEPIIRQFILTSENICQPKCITSERIGNAASKTAYNRIEDSIVKNECAHEDISENNMQFLEDTTYEIITDQEDMYVWLQNYCEAHKNQLKVRLYQDSLLSLSALYSISSKLEAALGKQVWLKSGGYLVIESTEALTVIDVNSGKCEVGKDSGDTFRKINLEAAEEIAIQLRLRNLSGIIIVDFINMQSGADDAQLLSHLRALVKQDRVKTSVVDMTALGLVEITRKKINKPLKEQFLSGS